MKHAFEAAGFKKEDMECYAALERYLKSGGTAERAHALVDQAAAKMAEGGQERPDAPDALASPRQPNPDAGPVHYDTREGFAGARDPIPGSGHRPVDAHRPYAADQEPKPAGADHIGRAAQLTTVRPGRVPESRIVPRNQAPSPERMRAVREAGHSSVGTIFDTRLPFDGRRIGDVRVSEYRQLANANVRFASLFLRLDTIAFERGKLGPGVTTRDLLKAKELKQVIADSGIIDVQPRIKKGILIEPNGQLSLVAGRM